MAVELQSMVGVVVLVHSGPPRITAVVERPPLPVELIAKHQLELSPFERLEHVLGQRIRIYPPRRGGGGQRPQAHQHAHEDWQEPRSRSPPAPWRSAPWWVEFSPTGRHGERYNTAFEVGLLSPIVGSPLKKRDKKKKMQV